MCDRRLVLPLLAVLLLAAPPRGVGAGNFETAPGAPLNPVVVNAWAATAQNFLTSPSPEVYSADLGAMLRDLRGLNPTDPVLEPLAGQVQAAARQLMRAPVPDGEDPGLPAKTLQLRTLAETPLGAFMTETERGAAPGLYQSYHERLSEEQRLDVGAKMSAIISQLRIPKIEESGVDASGAALAPHPSGLQSSARLVGSSPLAATMDLRKDQLTTERIHPIVKAVGDRFIYQAKRADGKGLMVSVAKEGDGAALLSEARKSQRFERKADELGLQLNFNRLVGVARRGLGELFNIKNGPATPETVLVTEMIPDAKPLISYLETEGMIEKPPLEAAVDELHRAGFAVGQDIGEHFYIDADDKLWLTTTGKLFEAGEPGFEQAKAADDRFVASLDGLMGRAAIGRDIGFLMRRVSVLEDIREGRAPSDQGYFVKVAKFNHIDPADRRAPAIVREFLENRIPIKFVKLSERIASLPGSIRGSYERELRRARVPEELRAAKPDAKIMVIQTAEKTNADMKEEYEALKRIGVVRADGEFAPPFKSGTSVRIAYAKEIRLARAYKSSKDYSNQIGFWHLPVDQLYERGTDRTVLKSAAELQEELALPDKPTHVAINTIHNAVLYYAIGAEAFGHAGGELQVYVRNSVANISNHAELTLELR